MTEDTKDKRKHKKIRARRYKEDGTYDFRPLNHQEYFTNYHTKGAELIECPLLFVVCCLLSVVCCFVVCCLLQQDCQEIIYVLPEQAKSM